MLTEAIDVAEQERDRQSPGNRAQRQEVAAQAQRHEAQDRGDAAGQNDSEHQPEPGRIAVQRCDPCRCISRDTDEGCLTERNNAAAAGQQRQLDGGKRVDADIVQQGDAERIEHEGRRPEAGDRRGDDETDLLQCHSSTSSSECCEASERQSRTGISSEKTMTSFKVLLWNEAKLSIMPTPNAPSAAPG